MARPAVDMGVYGNFRGSAIVQAMRSRKSTDLTAEAEVGRKSSALCHLANIAYRVGRTLKIEPATEAICDDAEASALSTRAYRPGYEVPQNV